MGKFSDLKIIEKIPEMSLNKIRELWINALRILADQRKSKEHGNARRVIDAIKIEWGRRQKIPLNPDDYFKWPSTDAPGGDGRINTQDWIEEGALKYLGYEVNATADLPKSRRQKILREIFSAPIPPVFPPDHVSEWGRPESSQRLKKMAEAIATFAINAKRRRDSRLSIAIGRWEEDLRFLYIEYYVDKFHFDWPSTQLPF